MKNCFDRTPHTMKDWLLLAAGAAAVFAAADWLPDVLRGAGAFLGLLAPFGWGLLLAYVLDIPTRFFAQKLFGGRRGGAMAVSYALFFGALAGHLLKKPKWTYDRDSGGYGPNYNQNYDVMDYKLGTLCAHFWIDRMDAHRALGDCVDTAKVFRYLLEKKIDTTAGFDS